MKNTAWVLLFFCLAGAAAQEIPPIQQYKSKISFAGNQNWMISQDEKALYIPLIIKAYSNLEVQIGN